MHKRTAYLGIFLIGICILLKIFPYQRNIAEKIVCNKGAITLINHKKTIVLIDPGFIASRQSYESYISYTLIPAIIQKTGSLTLDHVIIGKFNKRVLDAVQFLATKLTIRDLYIPAWKGRIPGFAWQSYVKLKKTITENNGRLFSISYKKQINLGKDAVIWIEPAAKNTAYYEATYKQLKVTDAITDQKIQNRNNH